MKTFIICVVFTSLMFSANSMIFAATKEDACKKFINHPNEKSYNSCSKLVGDSLYSSSASNIYGERINTPIQVHLFDNWKLFGKFLKLLKRNNKYALELAFQMYPLADGGVLEDLLAQIGMAVKTNPKFILSMLLKYKIRRLESFIIRCPVDDFADNEKGKTVELAERIKALRTVNESELVGLRDRCINILMMHSDL